MGDIPPQASITSIPQIRGIWTAATGVTLDHTPGEEGVETPLPNDYQTSKSPPVGRCLSSFRREGLKENCSMC